MEASDGVQVLYIMRCSVIRYSVAAIPACGGGVCMPCTNVVLVSILVS